MTAATAEMILDGPVGRAAERRARRRVGEAARRLGIDVVAARDAGHALAGVEDDVENGRRQPDQPLDPAAHGELRRCAMRHGARL